MLPLNLRFCLDTVSELAPSGKILDFGCGAGDAVREGLAIGLDIYGCEIFYEGGNTRETVRGTGLLGSKIMEMQKSCLPFPDQSFDVVYNNMVFEHVDDLDGVLREIARVLKPGGAVLSLFPFSNCWKEGHLGIPFAHKFNPDSKLAFAYVSTMYRLGLGTFRGETPEKWTRKMLNWLRDWCYYRPKSTVLGLYEKNGLTWEPFESRYILWRLKATGRPTAQAAWLLKHFPRIGTEVFERLGSAVGVSHLKAHRTR